MPEVEKLPTGILGLDHITAGGLPRGRTVLVSGTSGSGKTVLASQFLVEGIKVGEPGVFVTFEESPEEIQRNMLGFGWDIERWVEEGKLAFVDASPQPNQETIAAGHYDLGALIARIEYAVRKVKAQRVAIDSLGAIFAQINDAHLLRGELHRLVTALRKLGVTAIITAERTEEYGPVARFGIEEFVADNVMILRNVLEDGKRRRTVEILKFRGANHYKGEYPFSIIPELGVVVIPLSEIKLAQKSTDVRVTSGNEVLDRMCGGGFFRDSIILVSGATGTGKTLMCTEFIAGGVGNGEKCLLFAYEESRDQLIRNARGWSQDFEAMEKEGKLRIICIYPEVMGLEDHLIAMKDAVEEFGPDRVAVDGLSALERISTVKGFREFVIGITSFLKEKQITSMFTSATPTLTGGTSITESHISTITDCIIILRYVEAFGEVRRGIAVLKMRGSAHDKTIREFTIDGEGMHIGEPFANVAGILTGNPSIVPQEEMERLTRMFEKGGM